MSLDDFWDGYQSGWDADLRLVDPAITPGRTLHHGPSGAMAVFWSVRGRWSDTALAELRSCLITLLPERTSCRIISLGVVQVVVFVGVTPNRRFRTTDLRYVDEVDDTVQCAEYVLSRVVARASNTFPAGPGFQDVPALYDPEPRAAEAYRSARAALGDGVFPNIENETPAHHPPAEWSDLHETSPFDLRMGRYNFYEGRAYRGGEPLQ